MSKEETKKLTASEKKAGALQLLLIVAIVTEQKNAQLLKGSTIDYKDLIDRITGETAAGKNDALAFPSGFVASTNGLKVMEKLKVKDDAVLDVAELLNVPEFYDDVTSHREVINHILELIK